jgi:hemolysin D
MESANEASGMSADAGQDRRSPANENVKPGKRGNQEPASRPVRRPAAASEFQSDALEIEERKPPRLARATLYVVAAFILFAVGWASFSEIDEIVAAPGKLVTTAPNIVVQPLETSVIRSIEVTVGDVVRVGTTLAALDSTFTEADVKQLRSREASYAAQIKRLETEIEGLDYVESPAASDDERLQAAIFRQRQAHHLAQLRSLDERIAALEAKMATNRSDQSALVARLDVLREIEGMRDKLIAANAGSKLTLLEARHARLNVDGSLANLYASVGELMHELESARAEREAYDEQFRREALEELVELRSKHDSAAEELNKAELRRQMVALTAPADAVVLEVAKRSIGSIVREAEPVFTLVPLDVPLEAEVLVEARDIGHVGPEQEVRVKLDAFPFQKHGTASGVVRTISEDAFTDEGKGERSFYRARVVLTDSRLERIPETFRLIPGMTVVAEIKVGRRSVLSYFLYPLLRGLDESIREPS